MTPAQIVVVRRSWSRIRPVADQVIGDFYRRLFTLDPGLEALFAGVDMVRQRQKFVEMLDDIVVALDEPTRLLIELAEAGQRHAGYGVKDSDYEVVETALLDAIGEAIGPGPSGGGEVREAWRAAYALAAGAMKRGAGRREGYPARDA